MTEQSRAPSPEIAQLLETILPDGASDTERADFARGLTILAELLGEIDANEAPAKTGGSVARHE
jgi:hypothetical protein